MVIGVVVASAPQDNETKVKVNIAMATMAAPVMDFIAAPMYPMNRML